MSSSLQELCRKNLPDDILPEFFDDYVLQLLGLHWQDHGSLQRTGKNQVLVQQEPIHINEALKVAASEGNFEIVELLLSWKADPRYAVVGALESKYYDLVYKYYNLIEDRHDMLPLIQNSETFERCHELNNCSLKCLFKHAVIYDKLPILQKYADYLDGWPYCNQMLFELACKKQKYNMVVWIEGVLGVGNFTILFTIAIIKRDLQLYSLGYSIILERMYSCGYDPTFLLNHYLRVVSTKGLLPFVLKTIEYGGSKEIAITLAKKYQHETILRYFETRKSQEC
uniref:Protein MGF 505-3R n=1 Tax=African swine fever virus (isolate Pig/Kenya/KEN-50/1950) TaxID=561445 RepID=5053R_ASFK5|nr:RecName: Full=Protein MGF 505-3R [African swine fever virus pig/Kenya/KEN-50/1950]